MKLAENFLWSRGFFVVLALGTIALGLAVHFHGDALGRTSRDVSGDAIWAAMIAWCVATVVPGASIRDRGFAALVICWVVEVSQLYHTPGLDALRRTTLGELTLGGGFDPRDLLAYVLGVLAAMLLEWTLRRRLMRVSHRGVQ